MTRWFVWHKMFDGIEWHGFSKMKMVPFYKVGYIFDSENTLHFQNHSQLHFFHYYDDSSYTRKNYVKMSKCNFYSSHKLRNTSNELQIIRQQEMIKPISWKTALKRQMQMHTALEVRMSAKKIYWRTVVNENRSQNGNLGLGMYKIFQKLIFSISKIPTGKLVVLFMVNFV